MTDMTTRDGFLLDATDISLRIRILRDALTKTPVQPEECRDYEEAMRCLSLAVSSMAAAQAWLTALGGNTGRCLLTARKAVRCD